MQMNLAIERNANGWFYVVLNGNRVAEVETIGQAEEVCNWWRNGCQS